MCGSLMHFNDNANGKEGKRKQKCQMGGKTEINNKRTWHFLAKLKKNQQI